jgi:uncharacterized protein (TIRG00374 family)
LKGKVRLAVGFVIGAGFLWWALGKLDLAAAGKILSTARFEWIVAAVVLLMAGYALRSYRWFLMLRSVGADATYGAAYRIFLASVAMNNVLPFRAGDVARAVSYRNELGATTSQILGTMVVERILDFLSLLFVFFIALLGVPEGRVPTRYLDLARTFLGAMVVALVVLLLFARPVRKRLEGKGKVTDAFARFLASVEAVAPLRSLVPLILISLPAWLLESGLFVATAHALRLDVPIGGPMLAMATGTLATLIPSTPGYVGTFDAATAEGLKAYGIADTPATVFALTSHVVLWVPLTAVGFLLLSLFSLRKAAVSSS